MCLLLEVDDPESAEVTIWNVECKRCGQLHNNGDPIKLKNVKVYHEEIGDKGSLIDIVETKEELTCSGCGDNLLSMVCIYCPSQDSLADILFKGR